MRFNKRKGFVYGVGVNDADYRISKCEVVNGKSKQVWICPFYMYWLNMLKRCYSIAHQKARPTYIGCSVINDWLLFSNFKSWMQTQDWEGKQLDKDVLVRGNKEYGSDTCVFLDNRTNSFVNEKANSGDVLPIGVHCKADGKFKAQGKCVSTGNKYLGTYFTAEEAHQAWLKFKLEQAYILADRYADR